MWLIGIYIYWLDGDIRFHMMLVACWLMQVKKLVKTFKAQKTNSGFICKYILPNKQICETIYWWIIPTLSKIFTYSIDLIWNKGFLRNILAYFILIPEQLDYKNILRVCVPERWVRFHCYHLLYTIIICLVRRYVRLRIIFTVNFRRQYRWIWETQLNRLSQNVPFT